MSEPLPLADSEFAFIDETKADWFTRRLLATIKARDELLSSLAEKREEIEKLKADVARFSTLADERHDLLWGERRKVDILSKQVTELWAKLPKRAV